MRAQDVKDTIEYYEKLLERRKADAVGAIKEGSFWTAQTALGECIGYETVLGELRFQLERMEVGK